MPDTDKNLFLHPEQLCIGIHVHLDLSWMDHPFPFSSFRIKSEAQIAQIRKLGLEKVRYSAERSLCAPLEIGAAGAQANAETEPDNEPDAALTSKRERVGRLRAQRKTINACEREFVEATRSLKAINKNLFARPEETREKATELVSSMAGALLTERDIAVNLMPERIAGEDLYQHSLNVTVLSLMLARELNASREALIQLGIGALFHDIGKRDVPDRLLLSPDSLSRAELTLVQEHVTYGVGIGRKLGLSHEAIAVIAQHHETVNGIGYPHRLAGEKISLLAKIVAIANTYDNLCNPVNPQKAQTPHEALSLMYSQKRERFEPGPLSVFIRCLGVYPPGTIVVLGNEAFGMVMSVNSTRPLRPVVQIYDPKVPRDEPILLDLEHEPDLTVSRTIRPAQLPREVFDYLSPRRRVSYYFDATGAESPPTAETGAP